MGGGASRLAVAEARRDTQRRDQDDGGEECCAF
jgi:hypothetical protein